MLTGSSRFAIFFLARYFKAVLKQAHLDFSKRYKSQTRADIRESAWITIPYRDVFPAVWLSSALFVPRNPQALRRKPGD